MSVKELCAILSFPDSPVENDGAWQKIEDELGISFPDDYKQFIDIFGTAYIGNFMYVLNPFAENRNFNFSEQHIMILEAFREIGSFFGGEKFPYPLYPDKGGLLPWGFSINGDHLSMSSFLVKLLKKEIQSEILGDNLRITCESVK
jgi:hypothetical protein